MNSKRPKLNLIQSCFFEAMRGQGSGLGKLIEPIGQLSEQDCVNIYARGYKARLLEVLADTFESCWWALGDNAFFAIAGTYIDEHPSHVYDLDLYGETFPDHLELMRKKLLGIEHLEFLNELAKFEWLFKTIFHKKNISRRMIDWNGLLTQTKAAHLNLSDSARLFSSSKNVYAIWRQRKSEEKDLNESLIAQPFRSIIYKDNSQVFVKELSTASFSLLNAIAKFGNILQALEQLPHIVPGISAMDVQSAFSTLSELPVFEANEPAHAKTTI